MKVYSSKVKDSKYSLIFIHGWGGNEHSLECLKQLYQTKYDCYLLCLSGFGSELLETSYKIDNYLVEIDQFIEEEKLNNVVLIGHSFGGKLSLMLKLLHPQYQVIAIAPSIIKNPFSLSIFLKIRLYKFLKRCHFKIPKFLLGSRDYQNTSSYLRQTFLNVHHAYLTKEEVKQLQSALIIAFKEDQEVKYPSLKKLSRWNHNLKLVSFSGNHFAYIETLFDIYHSINGFLKEQDNG